MRSSQKVFFFTSILLTQSAFALNLQSYRFTDSYRYSVLDDSLMEKFDGKYVVTASFATVHSPFYYSDTYLHTKRKDIIDSNNILTLGFTYYLNKNATIGLDVSGVHNTAFNSTTTSFGDSVVRSKINLKRTKSFSLSLNPQVYIPTGSREQFTTQGSVGGALSVVAEKSFNRFHLLASLGAMSSKNNRYVDVDHRQLALAQLGASYDVTEKLNVNLEAFRNIPLVDDTYQDEGKYFLTGKHKTHKNFSTYFGGGISGWGDVQRDSFSAFAGIKFHEAVAPVAQAVAVAAAAPMRQELKIPIDEIYFAHDRYKLTDSEKEKLNQYVEYLNDSGNEITNVTIEGYASRVGAPPYNMRLSRKRAEAVKAYLIEQGIRKDLLTTKGFGDTAPQVQDVGLNRKVQFKFKK